MKEKILNIQNKAKSLSWGCAQHSETEVMFAVGHKSYPRQVHYFVVSDDYNVSVVFNERLTLVKSCGDEAEVLKVIYDLLKQWFPAKGGVSC